MKHLVISYLIQHWIFVISAIAGAIGYNIWSNKSSMSLAKKLLGFLAIAIVLHVIEEWIYPAGLHYIHNMQFDTPAPNKYPMNQFSDMITNFVAIVIAGYGMWKHSEKMPVHIASLLFCVLEVVLHTQLGFLGIKLFGNQGFSFPYSPGSATAFLLFLPIAIGNAIVIKRNNGFTFRNIALGLLLLVIIMVIIIVIPEGGLKDLNTPYGFPNNGLYDHYLIGK